MDGQCGASKEGQRKVEDVRWLHRPYKVCPKDSYPLPSIDALVDNASGCRLLSFLDAFFGFKQIMMQDNIYDRAVLLLLYGDALWTEERRCHLAQVDGQSISTHVRVKCPSIRRWHGGHLPVKGAARSRPGRAFPHDNKVQAEVEPR